MTGREFRSAVDLAEDEMFAEDVKVNDATANDVPSMTSRLMTFRPTMVGL